MALRCGERVLETSTTTGTGSFTLAGAVAGYQTFLLGVGNGNTTYYLITDGTNWEKGLGTYTSSGSVLSRDTVYESSAGGAKVSFPSGEKNVFSDAPANIFDGTLASQIDAASLGGSTEADLLARANHTGTQALATISDAGDLAALDTVNNAQWNGTDLSVANGGTGASTLTAGSLLVGHGTSAISGDYTVQTTLSSSTTAIPRADAVQNAINAIQQGANIKIGTFTSSGATQTITGVGFTPRAVIFLGFYGDLSGGRYTSIGFSNVTSDYSLAHRFDGTNTSYENSGTLSINVKEDSSNKVEGQISAFSSDGFTVTWVNDDRAATIYYLVIG